MRFLFLIISCFLFISSVYSLSFILPAGVTKCLSEDVPKKELLVGSYSILPATVPTGISVKVFDPLANILFERSADTVFSSGGTTAAEGKFGFPAQVAGEYKVCFINVNSNSRAGERTVSLSLETGLAAKDYSEIAKKDSLKPIEVELKKYTDLIGETYNTMLYLKGREESMRNTNESTNSRVLHYSLFAMFVLVILGIWQVRHLRTFFKSKKLIS